MSYLFQDEMKLFGPASALFPAQMIAYAWFERHRTYNQSGIDFMKGVVAQFVQKGLLSTPRLVYGKSSQYADIESDASFTEADLVAWNSWLAGNCDTAPYTNLNNSDSRAVCIGVGSATSTTTASATTTTSAAPT
ncbi:uncharacterized protein Aud_005079 [Aspergillus udagawae]|uniref:Uncharacterized protein n=1 Tax=Aspergillus udagawae TaxID=91492 RepID=A0A8E0QNS1_9EURO|nr:uncharacterized protein Aud_005079 [Aspergillus udagawae]GIC88682.1 hypothetical protein Aud_005079 [Aspergillus udagawae]